MIFAEPLPIDVSRLFVDPDMFDSPRSFSKAGFDVRDRSGSGIMVGSHEDAPGYLFKKYNNDRRPDEQLENYQCRIEGSQRLRVLIADRALRNIVTPRKWLHELPPSFARKRKGRAHASHVLVVDRFELASKHETEHAYHDIDEATLRELCAVVFHFNGLDSTPKNVPFTRDGRAAFIDTESWDRHHGREHFKYIGKFLSSTSRSLARGFFEELART